MTGAAHDVAMGTVRHIVIPVFDGMQSLDLTGPLEVFDGARQVSGDGYRISVASVGASPVRTSSRLTIVPDTDLIALDATVEPIDTILVPGGTSARSFGEFPELVGWVRRSAPHARRVTSVCTGAFLLAEAGLLDGRRVATHWSACDLLAARYPAIDVDPDPIFVRDGHIATSAGVTAGMDLALALVEEDLGREAALTIARWMVLFLRRPGGQSQFSAHLAAQFADRDDLRDLQMWMAEHLDDDLSVAALARRVGMSDRHFARCFVAETGVTPARWVDRIRVEAARRRLEESDRSVELVAAECGFGTPETMRRAFLRLLATTPSDYRRRFRSSPGLSA